jgi:hypothetical protein
VNIYEIQSDLLQSNWWHWLVAHRVAFLLATVILLLAFAWIGGWLQKRRSTTAILTAVNDATFGRCVPRSRSGAWGFAISVEPPPEHFREFNISYQAVSIFDPIDLGRIWFGRAKTLFQIAGVLADVPTAEITWIRGLPPARSLGKNPGRAPWVQSRLDFVGAEYATRGANVGALKHVFQDMYVRFTLALLSITIQRERRPQLRVVAGGKLTVRDISPLITSVRALARAAMRE